MMSLKTGKLIAQVNTYRRAHANNQDKKEKTTGEPVPTKKKSNSHNHKLLGHPSTNIASLVYFPLGTANSAIISYQKK